MTSSPADHRARSLHERLIELSKIIAKEQTLQGAKIEAALPQHRKSAVNLAHYLGLRSADIRSLQLELASSGLSSLGRSEGHVRDNLLRLCAWLAGDPAEALSASLDGDLDREQAKAILRANTTALFGPRPAGRHVYIMVTAPSAAELTPSWAERILTAGADLLRINGAHGSPAEWQAISSTFKSQAAALGLPGRVIVDLPGPKLRAEVRALEETVLHVPRKKDRYGRTVAAARLPLVAEHRGGIALPVPADWLLRFEPGDRLSLVDAAGRRRRLLVEARPEGGHEASCARSLYLTAGLRLEWKRGNVRQEGRVGAFAPDPPVLTLSPGDVFVLRSDDPGGRVPEPLLVCPEPALLRQVREGERVILDDGKLVAVVESAHDGVLRCRVREALKSPARLRTGKGIAFPDSELSAPALGSGDEAALAFALEHADAVGVSFVSCAADVALVGDRIRQAGRPGFGMLLKIETRSAMQNLGGILFEALRYHPVGLMIARGDLAVELSFERLAEVQEEILWFGEACHLPVVWATQVLDTLAHSGLPTRAEVTDAAMSMRAECVMLNKGPRITDAVRTLADIISKMESHQYKKRSLYRGLAVARSAGSNAGAEKVVTLVVPPEPANAK